MTPAPAGAVVVDEPGPGVRRVLLNRAARRNAVNEEMLRGLLDAMDSPPPVVVLGSADPAVFCAGMDLDLGGDERTEVSDGLYGLYELMVAAESIIIAAIGGPAVGAGAQLAVASDVRVAHPDAWLRFPGVGHGLAVGAWGLPSMIGRGRALQVCTTMEKIPATTASSWGLVEVLDPDPASTALERAQELAGQDPAALARVKHICATATAVRQALSEERARNRAGWRGSIAGLDPKGSSRP